MQRIAPDAGLEEVRAKALRGAPLWRTLRAGGRQRLVGVLTVTDLAQQGRRPRRRRASRPTARRLARANLRCWRSGGGDPPGDAADGHGRRGVTCRSSIPRRHRRVVGFRARARRGAGPTSAPSCRRGGGAGRARPPEQLGPARDSARRRSQAAGAVCRRAARVDGVQQIASFTGFEQGPGRSGERPVPARRLVHGRLAGATGGSEPTVPGGEPPRPARCRSPPASAGR